MGKLGDSGAVGVTVDLDTMNIAPGGRREFDLDVRVSQVELGAMRYEVLPDPLQVNLAATRMVGGGWALEISFAPYLEGPCMRCLGPSRMSYPISTRELEDRQGGDDLDSPYVDGSQLDLSSWVRDALILNLPSTLLCREDCRGLCPVCGENLNDVSEAHHHEVPRDPRWSKLGEIKFD